MTEDTTAEALDEFVSEGLVTDIISVIRSGKEATAYLCHVHEDVGGSLAVAKVYHERERRDFANDQLYEVGQRLLRGHEERAVANKSDAGRVIQSALWVNNEFDVMSTLSYAGLDVPAPYAATERAILVEYAGADETPAPQLREVRSLTAGQAERLPERLLWNVEVMLRENVIHADLSPYNVLYADGLPVIIDLPQAVDPRFNKAAQRLLQRDVKNIASYFRRHGITLDHERWSDDLWRRFVLGEL